MSKIMKKVSAFFALMLMMVSLIPTAVSATSVSGSDDRKVVYMQVPSDWENPCVWAWDDDGNNVFDAWPGGEAEADAANSGWYYLHIPNWANHVIVNANEGSVQTEEQILEDGNVWITVEAADSTSVSYDKLTEGDVPEYVEKFTVHACVDDSWSNPCIWAWSAPDGTNAFEAWPGKEMKAEGEGWYTAKVPTWVNSIIINGNEGGVQTEDLSIDASEVWVTVEADGSADFSYVDPNKAEAPNVNIYVSAPSDWEKPCLWAWSAPDGTNVFNTWPGEELEQDEDGWLVKRIPGWVNSIIVNGNEGSVQTSDISIDAGVDVWLVVTDAENYELYYEKPEIGAAESGTEEVAAEETVEKSNTGLIVGGVIAVIAIVGIGAAVVVAKKKK